MRRVDLRALIWRQILFVTAVIGFISCVANQVKDIGNGDNIDDEALDSIIELCLDIPSAKDIFYDTSRGNAIARFRIRFAPTREERRLFDSIMSSEGEFIDSLLSNNILSTVPYPETLIYEPTHITSQMYYRTNHRPYDIREYKWNGYHEFEFGYPCTGFQLFVKAILESYDRREAMIVIKNLMYMKYRIELIVKKYEIYLT